MTSPDHSMRKQSPEPNHPIARRDAASSPKSEDGTEARIDAGIDTWSPASSKFTDLKKAREDIHTYLEDYQHREMLRFVVVGSVDDGKSTLIGRLLHDTDQVFDDQLEDALRNSGPDGEIDFSLFTDGLRAEREQGITIDVAYRYFSTPRRKYIIADTPGHIQYTRNMATGASTADVALILIDARLGVQQQSRRHAYIASLLGIPHLVVAVNKMDLVAYKEQAYQEIRAEFSEFCTNLDFKDVLYFPVSAKMGDNVVDPSTRMPWYGGTTIMEHLETVPIHDDRNFNDFRMPVQYVIRPNQDYRGFAGQVASGIIRQGDPVVVLPSMRKSKVKRIDTYDGPREEAFPPMSVTICLEDEVDISRGDIIAHTENLPYSDRYIDAVMVWMNDKPLDPKASYFIKYTTQTVRANVSQVVWKSDPNTLDELPADKLELNDIGEVRWVCHRPIAYDPYKKNRSTGAFVVIDAMTNETMAAGVIQEPKNRKGSSPATPYNRADDFQIASGGSGKIDWEQQEGKPWTALSSEQRKALMGQQGTILYCSGSKKDLPALLYSTERKLLTMGHFAHAIVLTDSSLSAHIPTLQRFTKMGLLTLVTGPALTSEERIHLDSQLGKEGWNEVVLHPEPTEIAETSELTRQSDVSVTPSTIELFRNEALHDTHTRLINHLYEQGILSELRSK